MNGIIPLIMSALIFTPPATADIYRWQDSSGATHFGDEPPNQEEATRLYKGATWYSGQHPAEGAGLRPGEKKALRQFERRAKVTRPKRSRSTRPTPDQRRKERCIASRRKIGGISERLRRGYKPARGTALKLQRKTLEEWIFDNCETRWR